MIMMTSLAFLRRALAVISETIAVYKIKIAIKDWNAVVVKALG